MKAFAAAARSALSVLILSAERSPAPPAAAAGTAKGDHFAKPGANDRVWGALDKFAVRDPETFADYYGNDSFTVTVTDNNGNTPQSTRQVKVSIFADEMPPVRATLDIAPVVLGWTLRLLYFYLTDPPIHGIARMFYLFACVGFDVSDWQVMLVMAVKWPEMPAPTGGEGKTSCAGWHV